MATTTTTQAEFTMTAGINPLSRVAAYVSLLSAAIWLLLLVRWVTFSVFDWQPLAVELALARRPGIVAYLVYGAGLVVDAGLAWALLRDARSARGVGIGRNSLIIIAALVYYAATRDFYGAAVLVGIAGLGLVLLLRHTAWALAYPAAFWLFVFFLLPMVIVLITSFGDRSRLGTVTYPPFRLDNLGAYVDDYRRFFSRVGGDFIYLRIFWRSVWVATLNTLLCLLISYPFAYWIARRPARYRNVLVFLVMIPFWTNFLVRTYAWMLILRDTGIINNFWTITLHDLFVQLAPRAELFAQLAALTERRLPLLFNQGAVVVGLLYGYFPFMVLPLYSNLEKLDWSLLEAAADLGANTFRSTVRVLLPLSMPGIVAGSIIVFIPSLGAYVTPDLLGGARVSLLGNLLQQQFMTVRDWPFGSAIGFIMMAIMLAATMLYFRVSYRSSAAG